MIDSAAQSLVYCTLPSKSNTVSTSTCAVYDTLPGRRYTSKTCTSWPAMWRRSSAQRWGCARTSAWWNSGHGLWRTSHGRRRTGMVQRLWVWKLLYLISVKILWYCGMLFYPFWGCESKYAVVQYGTVHSTIQYTEYETHIIVNIIYIRGQYSTKRSGTVLYSPTVVYILYILFCTTVPYVLDGGVFTANQAKMMQELMTSQVVLHVCQQSKSNQNMLVWES